MLSMPGNDFRLLQDAATVGALASKFWFGGGQFFEQVIQKKRVPVKVASCEAAGFAGEAVGPSQAEALHPRGSIGFGARIDIEGEADGEEDATGQDRLEAVDEFLLFRGPKADPEEVRPHRLDLLKKMRLLFLIEITML